MEMIDRLVWQSQNRRVSPVLERLREKYNHPDNYYRFLYYLASRLKPPIALEIGVDEGVGSYHMLEAGCRVVGLDIRDDKLDLIVRGHPHYTFLHMSSLDSGEILERLVSEYGPIGLVYQDSSHHYLESKQEWELISPLCSMGAIWICDDITPAFYDPNHDPKDKGMVEYFKEIPRPLKKLYRDVLHIGNVMGVVIV